MPPRVTVADVARMAAVSAATVSRVFNTPDIVRPAVRERVTEAARALGYSPDPSARALRSRRTRIVGVVIPTLDHAIFARMVNAAQETFYAAGSMGLVATAGFDNTRLAGPLRLLIERGAEALLIVGRVEDEELRRFILDRRIPAVTTYAFEDGDIPSIGFDNREATRKVVDYLLALGHRRLAMLAGPTAGNDRQRARIHAFREALAACPEPTSGLVVERPYSLPNGAEATRRILADFPGVTAIVCSSDVFAFSAVAECRKLGLRVPEDISITGFDDFDFAGILDPPLTTVAVPAAEMGRRSAEALLDALAHGRPVPSLCLDTTLVVRGSAAAPPYPAQP